MPGHVILRCAVTGCLVSFVSKTPSTDLEETRHDARQEKDWGILSRPVAELHDICPACLAGFNLRSMT